MALDTRFTHAADAVSPGGISILHDELMKDGIARFRGVREAKTLLRLAGAIGTVVYHRDSDSTGVTTICARTDELTASRGFAGFSRSELAPHTDGSGVAHPPHLLAVACARAAQSGGECLFVDSSDLFRYLADREPSVLVDLCRPRSAFYGGATGHLGAVFSRTRESRITVRLRLDDLARFSSRVERRLPVLRRVIEDLTVSVSLEPGEGYIVDNYRWLHGRRSFTGERILYRVHANIPPGSSLQPGFMIGRSAIRD